LLRLKDINTAYWGFIRTGKDPFPLSDKVNAFIGPSGSGKTTYMDAIRITLGDAKFENNRAMDHYIHPASNWAVVRVAFWNRDQEGRPFFPLGYAFDEVTFCVRLDRSNGECKREYYVFDGEFNNILELGQNPKLYRTIQKNHTAYLKLLEEVGISTSFRRLMMMRPELVQNTVSQQPHELFKLIFDLKGQKYIQEEHEKAQEVLRNLIIEEGNTAKELHNAEFKLTEYERKKELYEQNEKNKIEYHSLSHLLLKRKFWDSQKEIAAQREAFNEAVKVRDNMVEQAKLLKAELEALQDEYKQASDTKDTFKEKIGSEQDKKDTLSKQVALLEENLNKSEKRIAEIELIDPEDIDELEKKRDRLEKKVNQLNATISQINTNIEETSLRLDSLNKNQSVFPSWVNTFQHVLKSNKVPAKMLADCIQVIPEYEAWLPAIEAYLGRERYRVIIPLDYQLKSKKLQEQYQYIARVSVPKPAKHVLKNTKLKDTFASLRQAIIVEHEELIGGYLDRLNNIYLVSTVEEGHQLQRDGYISLTQKGLIQDSDGAIFVKTNEFVCGSVARERYKNELSKQLQTHYHSLKDIEIKYAYKKDLLKECEKHILNQVDRLSLPQLHLLFEQGSAKYKQLLLQINDSTKTIQDLTDKQESAWELLNKMTALKERKIAEIDSNNKYLQQQELTLNGYKGQIGKLEQQVQTSEKALREVGYDDHALEFLDIEVDMDKIFFKADGTEWTQDQLSEKVKDLREATDRFYYENSDINAGLIAMVEPQKNRVMQLKTILEKAIAERLEWEERLENAEISLRHHVKETMSQYIEEFTEMANMLGAKAQGKLDQEGPSYNQWKLHLKLAFDGKELKPYSDPIFSSGQRAAISIMLLLASLSNTKEGTQNSLMFLDEPTSRVDDARANEIGTILQKTNVQYFITHQVSASLISVDWINHGIVFSKLRDGQDFADDPIFQSRRIINE
jgi:chromosome segregation protein